MRMRTICVLSLVFGCLVAGVVEAQIEERRPKNIIVMISDGCGYNHVAAAGLFDKGRADAAVYQNFNVKLGMTTFMVNDSYEPDKAWEDFNYVKSGYTDSAAAGTALATGVKTTKGTLGMDANGKPIPNVVEYAEKQGKATGVVSSVLFNSATPAAFVVHNGSRYNYASIGAEMVQVSDLDVIMGCGHPLFDSNGKSIKDKPNYTYVGGRWWAALVEGTAGATVDADHNGVRDDAWTLIETREQFQALAEGEVPKRVFGMAQVPMALQQERAAKRDSRRDLAFEAPFIENVPTLPEMTAGALNILDNDPDGFFLMVEGGAVDLTGHRNQLGRLIEEQMDFDKAVETVVGWVEENSSWAETLIIVTADHECGYLTVSRSETAPVPRADLPLTVKKAGEMPAMQWNSDQHTNSLVPFFAKGEGADRFKECVVGTDPKRGPYIDNTAVGRITCELFK